MNLSRISVKRPVAVTMVVLIFVVMGLYSLTMFSMELMPEMEMTMSIVYTSYPNVGSEEVENLVTKTIEGAVSSVSGVESITSQSSEGTSMILLQFASDTDMDRATQNIKEKIDLVEDYLPEGAGDPMVMAMDTSMMPVMMMSVSYEGMDIIQTKKYVENNVQNKLESVDGVASVNVAGAQDRVIEIEVDPERLFGYGVDMSAIASSIAAQNVNLPAGTVDNRGKNLTLRAVGKFESTDEINEIPLVTPEGQVIYLRDVASVKDTYTEKTTLARLNGQDSLSITITSESDANTVDVVDDIMATLEGIQSQNPKFSYNITMESGSYIKESISGVAQSAVTGALLAVFILLLFLANFRTSMVIGIAMPISVITTFVGMYFSGMTINVVSLGGLSLGVGMLVDNSVVVLENIFRRRTDLGEDAENSAIIGAGEVLGAVLASVLTTCIVYVPILFIDNIMAIMFKQLAFSIIFSQAASLLTTFLLVPMLSSRITENKPNRKLAFILDPFAKFMEKAYVIYEKALKWVLSHKKVFMSSVMGAFVLSLVVLGFMGMTLMPESDEGTFTVNIELPHGTDLEKTNDMTLKIEEIILKNKNVETVFANVGTGGMAAMGQTSKNASSVTVTLKEKRRASTDEVAQEIREELSNVAGAVITIAESSSMGMSSNEISFEFTGDDDKVLEKYVLQAQKILEDIEGVVETETSIADKKGEMQIRIDPARASRYGMSTATVANYVGSVITGKTAGRYTEGGQEYDIDIVYPDGYAEDVDALRNLSIKTMTGQWISLSDVADVVEATSSSTLTRVDQKRVITLSGKLFNTDMGSVNKKFDKALKSIPVPDGISRNTGGTFEVMIEAISSLILAIFLGILLMYMVMAAQFENLLQPFIILFTLPLAMIGVVLSLILTFSPLSVVGCIGILMLMGIVVNNAIVLIDFINTAKKENPDMPRTELLVYSGITRMRPVLMTSLTSILGFLPMAMASASSGGAMMKPLAVVLVGGLTVGTFLTLLVIPVVYAIFDDIKLKRQSKKLSKNQ